MPGASWSLWSCFFNHLVTDEVLQEAVHVRHYLLLSNYTEDKVQRQAAGPSHACFIEPSALRSLVSKVPLVKDLEELLRNLRTQYLHALEYIAGPLRARLEVQVLADLIIRCLLTKPWPQDPTGIQVLCPTGKYFKKTRPR